MRIGAELPTLEPNEAPATTSQRAPQPMAQQSAFSKSAKEVPSARETQQPASEHNHGGIPELDLSFRKDSDGITYYVLTDSQSGQVVREIPAKEVRQVSGGVAQYLKAQAAQTTRKTDSKA